MIYHHFCRILLESKIFTIDILLDSLTYFRGLILKTKINSTIYLYNILTTKRFNKILNKNNIGHNYSSMIKGLYKSMTYCNLQNFSKIINISLKLYNISNSKFLIGENHQSCKHISKYLFDSKTNTKCQSGYQKSYIDTHHLKEDHYSKSNNCSVSYI